MPTSLFARRVLMVRPRNFHLNPQTLQDNHFQSIEYVYSREEIESRIASEFDQLAQALQDQGIETRIFNQEDALDTPDAIFPNNWFSTHRNQTLILYPMKAENRRWERRPDIIQWLSSQYRSTLDFTEHEKSGRILEGTGSLVLDRVNRVAYASVSDRTHPKLVIEWCQKMNYRPVLFAAQDMNEKPIYHTNVVIAAGNGFMLVGKDAVGQASERSALNQHLNESGHTIIELSLEQLHQFAGNGLQLTNDKGEPVFVLSTGAWNSLSLFQQQTMLAHTQVIHSDLTLTEQLGGGSARCMLAELY